MTALPHEQPAPSSNAIHREPPVNLLAGAVALIAILAFCPILDNNFIILAD